MQSSEVKVNYDYKTQKGYIQDVQHRTIGLFKNLHLEIFQNAHFCYFREKIKGTTFVFVQKLRTNVI